MPKVPPEATKASYLLKATFFLQKLQSLGFFKLYNDVEKIAKEHKHAYSWKERKNWGIEETSWKTIDEIKIDPMLIFVHPNILKVYPSFLKYYRSIALLPQKGLATISGFGAVNDVENNDKTIPELKLNDVVHALNEILSALINLDKTLDEDKVKGMMYSTAGATIDGSWRNEIGEQGEKVIRSYILRILLDNNIVSGFIHKNGSSSLLNQWGTEDPVTKIAEIRSITTKNGSTVVFASEPDVELLASDGKTLGVIEIKAGIDPAGALERLGAMLKSFENTLEQNPQAETIFVASCITDEVEDRLKTSKSVKERFLLTDIINNEGKQGILFSSKILSLLGYKKTILTNKGE